MVKMGIKPKMHKAQGGKEMSAFLMSSMCAMGSTGTRVRNTWMRVLNLLGTE